MCVFAHLRYTVFYKCNGSWTLINSHICLYSRSEIPYDLFSKLTNTGNEKYTFRIFEGHLCQYFQN